jgi:hypothetical protein
VLAALSGGGTVGHVAAASFAADEGAAAAAAAAVVVAVVAVVAVVVVAGRGDRPGGLQLRCVALRDWPVAGWQASRRRERVMALVRPPPG